MRPEDELQRSLVSFHGRFVRQAHGVLFSVPNGTERDPQTAARLTGISAAKREALPDECSLMPAGLGVLHGVADLVLALPRGRLVWLEVKIPKIVWPAGGDQMILAGFKACTLHQPGRQSKAQKRFQIGIEALGHNYRVVRDLDDYSAVLQEFGVPVRARVRTECFVVSSARRENPGHHPGAPPP